MYYPITALLIFLLLLSPHAGSNDNYREVDIPQPTYTAFEKGEKIEYTVRYGMIHAGRASFEVRDTTVHIAGKPHYYVAAKGRSNRPFDLIFKVRDNHYSYINQETLLPRLYMRDTQQGDYDTTESIIFDHLNQTVKTGDKVHDVPVGIHDLLSAFYFARGVDFTQFKIGTKVNVKTFFAGELFPVGAVIVGEETISTSFGSFECLVIEPILIPGRVFRDQRDMKLYVTKDRNQIPVRIESKVYIGHVRADLIHAENLKFPLESRVN